MPYNGPSKGCKTCLRRKIKCDEGKPFCNNCAKSKGKYTCEGYRERSDLIFRDDTESAKTRAHKKAAVPVGEVQLPAPEEKIQDYYAHTDLSAGPIAPDYATTTTAATLQPQLHGTTPGTWIQGEASNAMTVVRGPVQQLQTQPQQQLQYVWNTGPPMTGLQPQNLEDQAVGVFFQDYAWAPKTYVFSLDFLPNEYGRAKRRNCMTSATEAVALAHLANKRNDAAALELASKRYIVAIRATNKALRNSSEALKDETMMAVHLLILYESINISTSDSKGKTSLSSWIYHLNGATSLVLQRGRAQLQKDIGLAMFRVQIFKTIVHGMITGTKASKIFDHTWESWKPNEHLMKVISEIPGMLERAKILLDPDLIRTKSSPYSNRSQINDVLTIEDFSTLIQLIEDIVTLDEKLEKSAAVVSAHGNEPSWIASNWHFYVASRIVLNRLLETCLSHYSNWHHISQFIRSSRSSSNDSSPTSGSTDHTFRSCFSPSPPPQPTLRLSKSHLTNRAVRTQSSLIDTLIDLVPASINLTNPFPEPPISSTTSPLNSYFLMWPLHVALRGSPHTTKTQRRWIRGVLMHISEREGLRMAGALVDEGCGVLDRLDRLGRLGVGEYG